MSGVAEKKEWFKNFFNAHYCIEPLRKGFDSLIQKEYPFDASFEEQYELVHKIKSQLDPQNIHDNYAGVFLYGSLYNDVVRYRTSFDKQIWSSSYAHIEYDLGRKLEDGLDKNRMFASALQHFLASKGFGNYRAINARCIGKSYLQLKDYSQALKYLSIAWDHGDKSPQAAGLMGKALVKTEDYGRALSYFLKARELGDGSLENQSYINECREITDFVEQVYFD